jgi:hypothetical protein
MMCAYVSIYINRLLALLAMLLLLMMIWMVMTIAIAQRRSVELVDFLGYLRGASMYYWPTAVAVAIAIDICCDIIDPRASRRFLSTTPMAGAC